MTDQTPSPSPHPGAHPEASAVPTTSPGWVATGDGTLPAEGPRPRSRVVRAVAPVARPVARAGRTVARPVAVAGRTVARPVAVAGRTVARPVAVAGRAVGRPVAKPARPIWETAFRDPVVEGHLRLEGMTFAERQLARIGLVTLTLLSVSLLFTEVWRGGDLLPVGTGERLVFLPNGLLPITLATLAVAWALLTWGALAASPAVRLFVAGVYLLTNAGLSRSVTIDVGDHLSLRWGPDIVQAGFYAPPAVLVLAAVLGWLPGHERWLPRVWRWLLPVLRLVMLVALAGFFLAQLWMHVSFTEEGFQGNVQSVVSGAVGEIDGLMLPLVLVSGVVVVVDFSLDVAEGAAIAGGEASRRVLQALLVAVVLAKIWFDVIDERADWATYLTDRPDAVAFTVLSVAWLGLLVRLVTLFPATEQFEVAKERLLYGAATALAAPQILNVLVLGVGVFWLTQVNGNEMPWFVDWFADHVSTIQSWSQPMMAGGAVVVGWWLLRISVRDGRTVRPLAREAGSGMVVVGGWMLPNFILASLEYSPGFSEPLVDLLVTAIVVAYLVARWRTASTATLVVLGTIVVFSWLVTNRGDWISFLGAMLGLPAILVVVVGVAYSLVGDAAFTRVSTRRMPQGARVLLFVGYLILSVSILHWMEATHDTSLADLAGDSGFFYLAVPWAAWLIARRLLRLDDEPIEGWADDPVPVPDDAAAEPSVDDPAVVGAPAR